MAELEELLIKVNSELGDLNGIDSAIEVLRTLKDISDKATNGADSLTKLAGAFSTLNKEGKNTQGIQNLKGQIGTLTGVLDQLADHTKNANKTIKQLGDLGDALTKFAGLSESLKGLEGISKGVNEMVGVLERLGGFGSDLKKTTTEINDVEKALKHSEKNLKNYAKNDALSKSIKDISKEIREEFGIKSRKGIQEIDEAVRKLYDSQIKSEKGIKGGNELYANSLQGISDAIKANFSYKESIDSTTKSVRDYVSATNKAGKKIGMADMVGEFGDDFKNMQNILGRAFKNKLRATKEGVQDLSEYLSEMNNQLGTQFDTTDVSKGLDQLVSTLKNARQATLDFKQASKQGLITDFDVFNGTDKVAHKVNELYKKELAKGSEGVSKPLKELTGLISNLDAISQGIENLKKLAEAIHGFNGLDDNVKSLGSVAMGIRNLIKAVAEADKIDEHSFDFIVHIKNALDTLANNSSGYGNIGSATTGLSKLMESLDSAKAMDLSKLDQLKAKMLELNDGEFKTTAHELSNALKQLNEAFALIDNSYENVFASIGTIDVGFKEATDGLYNVREQIEIISQDFDAVLSPVLNSRLVEILETLRSMNDSYKNVSGIAQGLGSLLHALTEIQEKKIVVDAYPVEELLDSLKALAESGLIEDVAQKFEKFQNISDAMARLMNAIKYFAIPLDINKHTVFDYLKQEITKFNEEIKGKFDETRNLLYGFKGVFEALQKDSSVVKEDNLFEWLKVELQELEKVVGQGGNIKVISNLLKGINDIARLMSDGSGINRKSPLFDDLKSKLTDLYNWSTKNGDMLTSFNTIARLLKSVVDLATVIGQGTTIRKDNNLFTNIAESISQFDDSVLGKLESIVPAFKSTSDLMKAINKLTYRNEATVTTWFGAVSDGLMNLNTATQGMGGVEKALNSVNRLVTTIDKSDKNMSVEDNPLKTIGLGLEKVTSELSKLTGTEKAVNNVSKLISTVASSEVADTNALSKVAVSIKAISEVGNVKEIGTLASNLNKLVETISNTKVDGRKSSALDKIYSSIKKFDDLKSDKGQLASLAKDFSKLISLVAENEDKVGADNVLTRLVTSLNGFKNIAENTKGLRGTLNAIGSLVRLASEKVDFGRDNPLSQLKRILGGFTNIAEGTKGLDKVVNSLTKAIELMKLVNGQDFKVDPTNNPFAVLKTQLEQFAPITESLAGLPKVIKALKDFAKDFDATSGLKIDAQPIANLISAVNLASGSAEAIKNFRDIIKAVTDATKKGNPSLLHDIAVGMTEISSNIDVFSKAGKLQSLIDIANAMVKMKDIELDKFKEMATAIREIMSALGSFNGNNNTIKITLDERGIINAEHELVNAHRTWEEFSADVLRDIQTIDLSSMFDISGSTKHLSAELKKAQQELDKALKEKERWQSSMKKTESIRGVEGAQEVEAYRRAYANFWKASKEADEYKNAVDRLNNALIARNGYELENDAEGYRLKKSLTDEKKQIEETLKSMRENSAQMSIFGDEAKQSEVISKLESRILDIDNVIERINNELQDGVSSSVEGLQEQVRQLNQEWDEQLKKVQQVSNELNKSLGESASAFGNAFKNIPIVKDSNVLSGIGDIFTKFGSQLSSGKIKLPFDNEQLANIQKFVGRMQQGLGVLGSFFSFWGKIYKDTQKAMDAMTNFTKKLMSFAKTMLTKVVGAFNAVTGAVSRVVSAVRSGAEGISVALRKIGEFGSKVFSVFGRLGGALAPALKGLKAIASLVTPKIVKTLASSDFSLGQIIKKSRALSKLMKLGTRWLTTMSRMLMRRTITAFLNQVKQAFEDLVVYEKNAGVAMLNLNTNVSKIFSALRISANQWIGAFEPLINAVTPTVLNFLNNVQAMGENVARFMAILTGQPYYIRAKQFYEDYGQNVEDTSKKVKDLTNGLDELNILNDSRSSSDDNQIKPEDMFEYVPVSGSWDGVLIQVQDILDKIKDFLKNIDWDWLKEKAREWVKKIFDIINVILRDKEFWQLLGKTVGELVNFLFTIINEAVHDLDWKALGRAIAEFIKNALDSIDWALIRDTVITTARGLAEKWNEIFADKELWTKIGETVAHIINDVIVAYLNNFAWTFDFKNMADSILLAIKKALEGIDWKQIHQMVEGWSQGIVDVFNEFATDSQAWIDVGETLKNVINEIIHAFDKLGDMDFASAVKNLKLAIETMLDIDWESFNESINKWAQNIADVINGLFADEEFLTTVATNIGKFANSIITGLKDLVDKIQAYDIGTALTNALKGGLGEIDWDNVFTLPADAINKLSEAIKGILDSMPEGTTLAQWITDHLVTGWEAVDWELLEDNVRRVIDGAVNFINGLLQNQDFWSSVGTTVGKTIDFVLDVTLRPLANVDWMALSNSLSEAVNKAVENIDFGRAGGDLGRLTQNIVNAVDNALAKINWREIGRRIGDGIASFLREINPISIAQTVYDAFVALSENISGILEKMLADGSFYRIGQILANAFYGTLGGLAYLLQNNKAQFASAISQFMTGITDFLKKNEKSIVKLLNAIIDGIVTILQRVTKEKASLVSQIASILKQTNLAELLGAIIGSAIQEWLSMGKIKTAILNSIMSGLLKGVSTAFSMIRPEDLAGKLVRLIVRGLVTLLAKLLIGKGLSALGGAIGSAAGPLGTILGLIVGFIIDQLLEHFNVYDYIVDGLGKLFNWDDKGKKDKATTQEELQKQIDEALDGMKLEGEVDVDMNYDFDDPEFNWDEYMEKRKGGIIIDDPQFGTITASQIEVETLKVLNLDVDEINADFLYLGEIFADKLHVAEIDSNMEGMNSGFNEMEKLFADNEGNIIGGTLTNPNKEYILNGDDFLKKLAKLSSDVLKQLSELLTNILEQLKEMFGFSGFDELLNQNKILGQVSVNPNFDSIYATNLNVDTITANTLRLSDIFASNLNVGNINGNINGVGNSIGNISGYTDFTNLISDIEKPIFEAGERWSDLSGLVPSAEDYIDSVKMPVSGQEIYDQILSSVQEMPKFLADNESSVSGGTLGNNDVKGLSAFDKKMAETLAGVQIKNLPSNAQHIHDYLMSFIGNEAGVYGLMGNLYAESGLLSNNLQDTKKGEGVTQKDIDYTNAINRGGNFLDNKGYGLAQWTTSDRKKALLNSLNGRSVDDLDAQLEYLKSELMSSQYKDVLETLRNASSIEEASDATLYGFEKPKVKNEAEAGLRLAYAQDIAGQLSGNETPQEKKDTEGIKNVDEFNVIDTSSTEGNGINPFSLRIEYAMAEIYNIIDKWLGRIIKLIKSFTDFDLFKELFGDLTGFGIIDSKFFDDVLLSIELIVDSLNEIKDKEFICNCGEKKDDTHLDNNTKAKSANTKAVEDNTKAIMDLIHNGLGNVTCNCNCGGNCGNCAMGQNGNIVKLPFYDAPLDYTVEDIHDTVNDINDGINHISDIVKDVPTVSNTGSGTGTPTNHETSGGTGTPISHTTGSDTGTSTNRGGKPTSGTTGGGLSYKSADILSLRDKDKEYKLYVTLEGERFSVGKDMPLDIRRRLMNGEGTLDLDGIPLSAFRGKFSTSGFDVSKDSSWRTMMKKLWGGGLSDDDLTIPSGKPTGTSSTSGGKPTNGTTGGKNPSSGNNYYGFDHTGESIIGDIVNDVIPTERSGKPATSTEHSVSNKPNYADAIADAQSGWTQNDNGGKPASDKPTQNYTTPDVKTGEIKDASGNVVGHLDGYWKDEDGKNGSYWLNGNKVSHDDYIKGQPNPSSSIAKASGKTFSDDFVSNYAWATPDVVTGMTDYYDADGNKIASVATKDIVAKQNEKNAEAIKKAEEERVANEKAKNEEARKKKNESTPIIYQGTDNLIGGVLTDKIKAQREAYTKTVEEYRKKAKEFMDIINKNGTDTQKALAENYFNSLNTNKAVSDITPYKFNYDKLEDIANQVKVTNAFGEDYKNIRVQTNGGIFAIKDLLKTESGQLALADVLDKYEKGKEVRFYKQGNGSSNSANKSDRITDEETVKDLISKLKSLGINAKSAKKKTDSSLPQDSKTSNSGNVVSASGGEVSEESSVADDSILGKILSAIKSNQTFSFIGKGGKYDWISSSKENPFNSKKYASLLDEILNGSYLPSMVNALTYTSSDPSVIKASFEKWYERFTAKGYEIGGIPNSGEIFVARENGTPEFVGSFGNKTAVANNDQIVTAVANGVSMANDRVVNAIENQTGSLENAIDRKNLDVKIGDRQIAEANRRGEKGLGNNFIQ